MRGSIMPSGKIKWFNSKKGYGFITEDKTERDIFLHVSALESSKLRTLKEEQKIEFDILNSKEKMEQNIFSGQVKEGDRIFKIDTTLIKNGTYFISVKTPHQSILRKILVKN